MEKEAIIQACLSALWALSATGVLWSATRLWQARATPRPDAQRARRLPLLLRGLLPLTPQLTPFFSQPGFRRQREQTTRQLVAAGYEDIVAADEFLALRALMPLVIGTSSGALLCVLLILAGEPLSGDNGTRLLACGVALFLWTLVYPTLWLKQTIANRHRLIVKALPFVIDLLTLSVEAGLDFMAAIKSILDRRAPDPLGEELARVLLEIQLGKTRREALRHMGDRIQQSDVQSLVMALVQADEMGVSIGAILRIQADQIRSKRFMRAEKLANEAPVKMLFPLVACIFPAVFLILLGPVILQMLHR